MKQLMHCSSCGREEEREPDESRFCGSFGGLDPHKEVLAGRFIDPCRGSMLLPGETYEEPEGAPLDLKIQSLDKEIASKTYSISEVRLWRPIK